MNIPSAGATLDRTSVHPLSTELPRSTMRRSTARVATFLSCCYPT